MFDNSILQRGFTEAYHIIDRMIQGIISAKRISCVNESTVIGEDDYSLNSFLWKY